MIRADSDNARDVAVAIVFQYQKLAITADSAHTLPHIRKFFLASYSLLRQSP